MFISLEKDKQNLDFQKTIPSFYQGGETLKGALIMESFEHVVEQDLYIRLKCIQTTSVPKKQRQSTQFLEEFKGYQDSTSSHQDSQEIN